MSKKLYYILVSAFRGLPDPSNPNAGGVYYLSNPPAHWRTNYCYSRIEPHNGILIVFDDEEEAWEFAISKPLQRIDIRVGQRYLEPAEFERLRTLHTLALLKT